MVEAVIKDHAGLANGPRCHLCQPHTTQGGKRQLQTLPLLSKKTAFIKLYILKSQFNMLRAPQPHHRLITPHGESGTPLVKDEG